tara:strand:- start:10165 stop:10818 length:654 start_codon:yes stop_codon:yes gene_type:complete
MKFILLGVVLSASQVSLANTLHASTEISALILLIKAIMIVSGIATVGVALQKLIKADNTSGEKKTGSYIGLMIVGTGAITIGFIIKVGSNTVFGTGLSNEAYAFMDHYSLDPGALQKYAEQSVHFAPGGKQTSEMVERMQVVLVQLVMLGGIYAISRAYAIAKLALESGSEMAGTTFAHKKIPIYSHFFGGLALINITETLTILNNTSVAILNSISG